ncbi:MAG: type 1 glutamine amidotransferase [Pseudomonadota bacterium]
MRIGILQCGHFPGYETSGIDVDRSFYRLLQGQGLWFQTWSVIDMDFPKIDAADGWLLTGSPHGAYEDLPFIPPLEDFIRQAAEAKTPMVGICFGHQIIAQALGGRVEKFSGGWAVGRHVYESKEGEALALNAWHQDQVVALPPGAEVIAKSEFCTNAALAYGDRILTYQPHPEHGVAEVAELLKRRGPDLPEALREGAAAGQSQPVDSQAIADRIGAFFRDAKG